MDPNFKEWMNEEIVLERWIGQDGALEPRYAAPEILPCFTRGSDRLFRDDSGKEFVAHKIVFLDGAEEIALKDKVTLANGSSPPIVGLVEATTETGGRSHWEVYLGWRR